MDFVAVLVEFPCEVVRLSWGALLVGLLWFW